MPAGRPPSLPAVVVLAAGWVLVSVTAAAGVVSLSLIDQVVLLGIAVVLPLSVGGAAWWWAVASGAALLSFLLDSGLAGLLVIPFLLTALAALLVRVRAASHRGGSRFADLADVLACLYAVVAAGALAASRFGITLFGVEEPIVELTAVHYIFAGSASLVLARATLERADSGWRRPAVAAVVLTALAPPIVALGFVTDSALPQIGGAMVMTLGVWLTATLQLHDALTARRDVAPSALLVVSGLAVWVPMVLAVAWASGQHWDVPILSVPDMARTHGLANAFAFVLCGLVARRLGRASIDSEQPVAP